MHITKIRHSCFVVKTDDCAMVFDYWLDYDGQNREFPSFLDSLDTDRPFYVFVSHGHKDHYNPAIFSWARRFGKIHYFVSNDVGKRIRHILNPSAVYNGPKVERERVSILRPGESFDDSLIRVEAAPSTDIGNSYIVGWRRKSLFHAGDLNVWFNSDEATQLEIRKALGDYKACLRDIGESLTGKGRSERPKIDVCFFPIDSRLGGEYYTGAGIFTEKFEVKRLFPMHFDWGDDEERTIRSRDAKKAIEFLDFDIERFIFLDNGKTCCIPED